MTIKKPGRKSVITAVENAVGVLRTQGEPPARNVVEIIADQSGQELRSLGDSLRMQRGILTERRAQVQHIVNELDSQINVLDHALRMIEAN